MDRLAGWLYDDLTRIGPHPLVTPEFCRRVAKGVLNASDDLAAALVVLGKKVGASTPTPTPVWEVVSAAREVVALWRRYQQRGDRDGVLDGVARLVVPVERLERAWQARMIEDAAAPS